MTVVATVAFFLCVIAYSAAATLFFLDLARSSTGLGGWGPRALTIGGTLHALHVVIASLLTRICPVETLPFALSFSGLMAVGAYLLLRRRLRIDALGALIAPLALTFVIGAQFVAGTPGAGDAVPRPLLVLHIAANVFGVGLFLLAGASGAFYVVEERRLKQKKKLGLSSRLPPLAALDKTAHRLLLAGFPLLTFGIVTGSLFIDHLSSMDGSELLRSLLGYASWILLAIVLLLRRIVGWTGRRAAYGTLAGVVCVLLVVLVYVFRVTPG